MNERLQLVMDALDRRASGDTAGTLWPAFERWLTGEMDGDGSDTRRTVEVGFQTGTDVDRYPVDVPGELDGSRAWYWIGFGAQLAGGNAGIVLWFPPSPSLAALRELPQWNAGNALGLDFIAFDPDGARAMLQQPLLRTVLVAAADQTPVAVERFTID